MLRQRGHLIVLCCILGLFGGGIFPGVFHPSSVLAQENTVTIHITGPSYPPGFSPAFFSVHVNDTVVFLNDASPAATFTLVADDNSFSSPPIAPGQQWSMTFSEPGAHEYRDLTYRSQMVGFLNVVASSVTLASTPAPGAVATEIAKIKAQQAASGVPSASKGLALWEILVIVGGILVILVIAFFLLIRYKRSSKVTKPLEEQTLSAPVEKKDDTI